jgi:ferrous iron transport protein A
MQATLTQVGTGERAKITAIEGGRGLRQQLFLRGLIEGKVVRVVSNYGPVTVEVDRNVVAIGRGMAQKIMVTRG